MGTVFFESTDDRHAYVVGGLTALERRIREVARQGATRAVVAAAPVAFGRPLPIPVEFVAVGSAPPDGARRERTAPMRHPGRANAMLVRSLVIAVTCCGLSRAAEAGMCFGDDDMLASVKTLEAMAKDPKHKPGEVWCLVGLQAKPKLVTRTIDACGAILARDPKFWVCVEWGARLGQKELGGVGLFAAVSAMYSIDPFKYGDPEGIAANLYEALGDPRAVPVIVDAWTQAIPKAEKRKNQSGAMEAWSGWRKVAARALGKLGGADEQRFLDSQAAETKDKSVKKVCLDAAKAIDARLAKPRSARRLRRLAGARPCATI